MTIKALDDAANGGPRSAKRVKLDSIGYEVLDDEPEPPAEPMVEMTFDNANPRVYRQSKQRVITPQELDDSIRDEIDSREIFDLIRNIKDPEHPLTLEQLNVVEPDNIFVDDQGNKCTVLFTPTISHCSLATLIGLAIQVKLLRCLPDRFKIDVRIAQGTHSTEDAVNKQLADKERVAAALENPHLLEVVNRMFE